MTKQEIRDIILAKKATLPSLAGLTSSSSTAVWANEVELAVEAIYAFNQVVEAEKAALIDHARRNKYGTVEWYQLQALKFQYGDNLSFDDTEGTYGYDVIDETKQIIERCSAVEISTTSAVVLKVAKDDGSGGLTALSSAELIAFTAYINKIKVAGTQIVILSAAADELEILGTVYYDAIYTLSDVKDNINTALQVYQDNFEFNGIIRKNDLIETIRDAEGVRDFVPSTLEATSTADGTLVITDSYETRSGYFNYSSADVADTLTYEAL